MGMKVNGTTGLTFPDTTTLASAGQASVRAWVNFNGTGTVAIRASYNVTSITDNGTGDYTVNFTTAMPDENYATVASGRANAGTFVSVSGPLSSATQTTTSSRVGSSALGGTVIDSEIITVAIFR